MSEDMSGQGGWEPSSERTGTWSAEEPPAADAPGVLHGVVLATMAEREWKFDDFGDGMVRARVHCRSADYEVFISSIEALQVVRCWVVMPVHVSEAWRVATCDLFNRVNHSNLLIGNFELHMDDGTPRWRASVDVEGGILVTRMVHNLITAGLAACDQYWPALMAVSVLGSTPEAAVRLVTEG